MGGTKPLWVRGSWPEDKFVGTDWSSMKVCSKLDSVVGVRPEDVAWEVMPLT